MSRKTTTLLGFAVLSLSSGAGSAFAQSSSPSLQGEIPFDFGRGRNVSVTERPRPEYQAIGILAGGFTVFPGIDLGLGASDNVYAQPGDGVADAIVSIAPQVRAVSNWSRHRLTVQAGGNFRRYLENSTLNEDGWYARTAGRVELGLDSVVDLSARAEQLFETRYSPSTGVTVRSAAPYRVNEVRASGQHSSGRLLFAASAEYADYEFSTIQLLDGTTISQSNRDRGILTGAAKVEYAVNPDASVYGQVVVDNSNYATELRPGVDNRDNTTFSILGGVSTDITALIRGRIGIGYTKRDYQSEIYRSFGGFAAEAQIEYFPSELTTVRLLARRRADDASTQGASGYFSNVASLRVDHELLRNLILNASANYELGTFVGIDSEAKTFRLGAGARYYVNRMFSLGFNVNHGRRRNSGEVRTGPSFNETSGGLSLSIRI